MEQKLTVRRSELTVPGHSLKMLTKAAESKADEVMMDLEDACAPSQKVEARKTVVEALKTLDFRGKYVCFRPNNVRTKLCYDDIITIVEGAGDKLDGLIIPKVFGPEEIHFVDFLLSQIEKKMGFPRRLRLEVLIETGKALERAYEIATASDRMESLIFGIADYAADIGATELVKDQFLHFAYAKQRVIQVAKAAGIDAVDNVTLVFKDEAQCRSDAANARTIGFDGKWAIHPTQVAIINEVFSPGPDEITRAQEIIEKYHAADAEGFGAIQIGNEMVDAATVKVEVKKLLRAHRAGQLDAKWFATVADRIHREFGYAFVEV